MKTQVIDNLLFNKDNVLVKGRLTVINKHKASISSSSLDGFALIYACRVKLPHEAVKAELVSL